MLLYILRHVNLKHQGLNFIKHYLFKAVELNQVNSGAQARNEIRESGLSLSTNNNMNFFVSKHILSQYFIFHFRHISWSL